MPRARPCRCGFALAMLVLATAGVTGCASLASPGQPAVHAITTSPASSPASPSAAASPPAMLTPASASPDVTLAYSRHEVAVVGVATFGSGNQDAAPSTLWLSTDLRHWRNVTPAAARLGSAAGDYPFFEHASFLNPTTGWVTTYSPAATSVTVYATTDGGRSWIVVARGGHSMAAGSTELIQLLTAGVAFTETLQPTGPRMSLSSTSDGGRSWRVVYGGPPPRQPGQPLAGPFEMPMLFVSASHGFAADGIAPTDSFGPAEADFFMTTDGGRRWTRQSPPMDRAGGSCPPASTAQSSCMYALPTFLTANRGVLPAEVISGSSATITFSTTSDAGSSWTAATTLRVAVPSAAARLTYPVRYPMLGVASATTWWAVLAGGNGTATYETRNAGRSWTKLTDHAGPRTAMAFDAIDANHAWLVDAPNGHSRVIYITSDGGRSWQPLHLS